MARMNWGKVQKDKRIRQYGTERAVLEEAVLRRPKKSREQRRRQTPAQPPATAKPYVRLIKARDLRVGGMKERSVDKPTRAPQKCVLCNGAILADDRVHKDREQRTVHKRCYWSRGFEIEPYGPSSSSPSNGGRGLGKRR